MTAPTHLAPALEPNCSRASRTGIDWNFEPLQPPGLAGAIVAAMLPVLLRASEIEVLAGADEDAILAVDSPRGLDGQIKPSRQMRSP